MANKLMMDVSEVVVNMVDGYPGGVAEIARQTGSVYAVLIKKTNPHNDKYHLTLREASRIADITNSPMLAQFFAERRGMICINAPDFDHLSDQALLDLILEMGKQQGEWMGEMMKALEDGKINWSEFKRIKKEYDDFVVAAAEVFSRIQSYLEAGELRADKHADFDR